MRGIEQALMLLLVVGLLIAVGAVIVWFGRALIWLVSPKPAEPEPDEDAEVQWALAVLGQPRLVAAGQYMHWRCVAEPCDAPPQTGFVVHDRTTCGGPSKCAMCNEKPRFSGASYRSAN